MRSTRQRVLSAVRAHFDEHGLSPSHREIADAAGIAVQRVQQYVEQLAEGGFLSYTRRAPRSIQLLDRLANYSEDEVRQTCAARGIVIAALKPPIAEGCQIGDCTCLMNWET